VLLTVPGVIAAKTKLVKKRNWKLFGMENEKRYKGTEQGCQIVYFQTKNNNLGFLSLGHFSRPFGILCDHFV
jgi:hypothetical protein